MYLWFSEFVDGARNAEVTVSPTTIYVWQLFRNPTQERYFQVQPVHSALAIFYAQSTFIGLVYCSFVKPQPLQGYGKL